jgi:hypothetical protein
VMPDNCTAPDRFLVEPPHHCDSHGLTARVQMLLVGLQQEHAVNTASPRRAISPVASPEYTPASPEHTPTPVELPIFPIRRTMAAPSGALPYYNSRGGGSSSTATTVSRTSSTSSLHLHLRLRLLGHRVARPSQRWQTDVLGCTRAPTESRPGTSRSGTVPTAVAAVPHRPERDAKIRSGVAGRWIWAALWSTSS